MMEAPISSLNLKGSTLLDFSIACVGYGKRFIASILGRGLELSCFEIALYLGSTFIIAMAVADAQWGHDIGDKKAIQLAKQVSQPALMAQGSHHQLKMD